MKLPREKYPICPECGKQMVAGAHMTSDDSRSIYCTNGSCNYYVSFEDLTTPVPPTQPTQESLSTKTDNQSKLSTPTITN